MSWAKNHIARLQNGETIQFRPKGNSMAGKIDSGQLVEVSLTDLMSPVLHLIKALTPEKVQIGNARGYINGWTSRERVYGRVTKIS